MFCMIQGKLKVAFQILLLMQDRHKTMALCCIGKLITLILQLIQEVYQMHYRHFTGLATLRVCP